MIIVSSNIFPNPELGIWDITWPIKRSPSFSTVKQVPANRIGEVHISLTPFVTWEYDLDVAFLKGDAAQTGGNSSWHRIVGFYGAQNGSFRSWYYSDPQDNGLDDNGDLIINQIGVGDGVTTLFQTTRNIQGMLDLIQNYVSTPNVYLNGFQVPSTGFGPPALPIGSQVSGGGFGTTTYLFAVTYVTESGETLPSAQGSFTVSASNLLVVHSPDTVPGAPIVGYNVYAVATSGAKTLQNSMPIPIGTNWTEPSTGLVVGAAIPVVNNTGWVIDDFGSLIFQHAPDPTVVVTWSGQFYFRCYFDEDKIPLEEMLFKIWSIKSLKFHTAMR